MRPVGTIEETETNAAYELTARQDRPVWPGACMMHVFRHIATDELWARDTLSDDEDFSWDGGCWYLVEPKTVTVYEAVPLPPMQDHPRQQRPIRVPCEPCEETRDISDIARAARVRPGWVGPRASDPA